MPTLDKQPILVIFFRFMSQLLLLPHQSKQQHPLTLKVLLVKKKIGNYSICDSIQCVCSHTFLLDFDIHHVF